MIALGCTTSRCSKYRSTVSSASRRSVRLPAEDGTLIPPLVFIPVAEEACGSSDKIGAWVLRQAKCTAATWPEDLTVAVNLSRRNSRREASATIVAAALKEAGLAPHHGSSKEITETLLLGDSEARWPETHSLKAMGVAIT